MNWGWARPQACRLEQALARSQVIPPPASRRAQSRQIRESARSGGLLRRRRRRTTVPDLGFVLLTVLLFGALMLAIKGAEKL